MKYKILSHTADLRLEVYGKTLEKLFSSAASALAEILAGNKSGILSRAKLPAEKIKIQSASINNLLIEFLNEVLSRSQINKRIYRVESLKLKENELTAEISGMPIGKFEKDVKAVTYYEADIKKENGIWKTKLVLDI